LCSIAVAGEKESVQAATKEGVVLKCGQVMQNDNCNNMSVFQVAKQLKAMDINKENIPGVALPKHLIVEPSFAMDWLEISWDELELKERVGAGTYLASVFLSTCCMM
jgi:hypothetical protein